jgi:Ca2+-binding RTX toxin-like protein
VSDETTETVTLGTGNDTVTGSASIDTVVLNTGSPTLSLLGADDIVETTDANFDGFNVINGGAGSDTIHVIDDASIIDNDFTNITLVEALLADDASDNNTIVLGTLAAAAGISTITGGLGVDNITLGAGFTNNVTIVGGGDLDIYNLSAFTGTASITGGSVVDTITLGSGNATISAGDGADVITLGAGNVNATLGITADGADADILIITNGQLTSADTVAGASGSDILRTSGAVTLVDSAFTNITAVEIIDAATNDGALTVTLGALAQTAGVVTVNGGDAIDTINASAYTASLTVDGAAGNDTITGGSAADQITGGAGDDTISVLEPAAVVNVIDTIIFDAAATNGVDTIIGFEAGTGVDVAQLAGADTTVTTGAGVAVFAIAAATGLVADAAFRLDSLIDTATTDVVELLATNSTNGDLSLATDGTELLKVLGITGDAATSITVDNDLDAVFLVAYDNGNAYLYSLVDSATAQTETLAADIKLVGVFENIAVGGFASGDFTVDA